MPKPKYKPKCKSPRVKSDDYPEHEYSNLGGWGQIASYQRQEAFFARRRAVWAAQIAAVIGG